MRLLLTKEALRQIFPNAPEAIINAFASDDGQEALGRVGLLDTRQRLSYAFANVEHECNGFTIPKLTENINYTAYRMAEVWPNRFSSAAAVQEKYGTQVGWQKKAFDDIYGNRMGNRPGTSDGSLFIGRGGPQITGRDGYKQVGDRAGLDLVSAPLLATEAKNQPAILAAFWDWKGLNKFADKGDFPGCYKAWNGGTNGAADRAARLAGNDPVIGRLKFVDDVVTPALPSPPIVPPQAPSISLWQRVAGWFS